MTSKQKKISLILLVTLTVAALIFANSGSEAIKVEIKTAETGIVEKTVSNTRAGTIKACRRAKLSPSIGGQIIALNIKEGEKVKKGTILMEVWNQDLKAQLKLTQSEARSSIAQANAICLKAELLQREADRLTQLYKTGSISEEQRDNAATQAKASKADCHAAQANAEVSQARINVAQANLLRSRLIAPFDGTIAEISGELNEYATPSPPGIPTPPTIDLINNNCFYVIAPIDEVDAASIKLNMPARIQLDAFRNHTFVGNVQRIGSYVLDIEKQARTIDIEIHFNNPADFQQLLAGYSADAEIILQTHNNVLRIPTTAIQNDNLIYIYHSEDKKLQARHIKTGLSNWEYTEITAGLEQGEKVVLTNNWENIKDGSLVQITEEKP